MREMSISENYEGEITPIRSNISRFSRGTVQSTFSKTRQVPALLDILRIRGAFSLPVKTVHGVPLLTDVARAANGVPRTVV